MPISKVPAKEQIPGHEYAEHLVSKPAEVSVLVEKKKKKEVYASSYKHDQVNTGLVVPPERLHTLHLLGSRTFNLGDYESSRIEVGLTVPCTKETIPQAFKFAEEFVESRIGEYQKLVDEVKGSG